mmetsp:Transcript_34251/g.57199  ORF Transcript_34251/g.57199 Transcript_34251/m.57199 type:complete len:335 (+) Transcript_34251:264-1268(+)
MGTSIPSPATGVPCPPSSLERTGPANLHPLCPSPEAPSPPPPEVLKGRHSGGPRCICSGTQVQRHTFPVLLRTGAAHFGLPNGGETRTSKLRPPVGVDHNSWRLLRRPSETTVHQDRSWVGVSRGGSGVAAPGVTPRLPPLDTAVSRRSRGRWSMRSGADRQLQCGRRQAHEAALDHWGGGGSHRSAPRCIRCAIHRGRRGGGLVSLLRRAAGQPTERHDGPGPRPGRDGSGPRHVVDECVVRGPLEPPGLLQISAAGGANVAGDVQEAAGRDEGLPRVTVADCEARVGDQRGQAVGPGRRGRREHRRGRGGRRGGGGQRGRGSQAIRHVHRGQ